MKTLETIRNEIWAAIETDDYNITTSDIESESFNQALILLKADEDAEIGFFSLSKDDVRLNGDKTELTIEGPALVLGRQVQTKITFSGNGPDRICVVDVGEYGDCKPQELAEKGLLDSSHVTFTLFGEEFKDVSLKASSDELTLTVEGKSTATDFLILENPKIKLTSVGFVLTRFIKFSGRTDTRFRRTGTFIVAGTAVRGSVELPVGIGQSGTLPRDPNTRFGVWNVVFDAGKKPINLEPAQVAKWLDPDDDKNKIFSEAPAEIGALKNFGLKRLTISFSFNGQLGSIRTVEVVVSTAEPWAVATGLVLNELDLVVALVGPLKSPAISTRVEAKAVVGNVPMQAILAISGESRAAFLSLSTQKPFKLSAISSFGNFKVDDPDMPVGDIEVDSAELTLVINLKSPEEKQKLRSIELKAAARDLNLTLIPRVLSITSIAQPKDNLPPLKPQFAVRLENPLTKLRVNARITGVLKLLEEYDVEFGLERIEGRWNLFAQTYDAIPLSSLVSKFAIDAPVASDLGIALSEGRLDQLQLTGLRAQYATSAAPQSDELSFSAAIAEIPSFKLGDVLLPDVKSLSVELFSVRERGIRRTSITLRSAFKFGEAAMSLALTYNGGWIVMIEALGLRGTYDGNTKVAQISLGNRTVGEIIQSVYSLVKPGATIELPEPWNLLNGISLDGVFLEIDFKKRRFGVTYNPTPDVDLGFTRVKEIGITYESGAKVMLSIKTSSLGNFNLDPSDPKSKLPVPTTVPVPAFDLQFLALGQRLSLTSTQEIRKVRDAMNLLKSSFKKTSPEDVLFGDGSGLKFDAQNGLLLGADFSAFGLLSMALVFNDSAFAGVALNLGGPRARYFRGLDFEILYKKVSEGVGVYQTEWSLPESLRQIELGAVSITMPVIAVDIYTSGRFRVDLGFPKNNDFSRSFQLQVFPYLGAGGFYFALPEAALTKRLPKTDRGEFRPVLSLGLGLSIGIGKSIQRGVFGAELSATFEGIVEGLLAFFKGTGSAPDSVYFWMQGTLGIVLRIRGTVRFSVITADVSLVSFARVSVVLESFEPVILSLSAGVTVNLVVQIGAGWLSADISCSFSTEVNEQFVIPVRNPGTPAWKVQLGAAQMPARSQRQIGRAAAAPVEVLTSEALLFDEEPPEAQDVEPLERPASPISLTPAENKPIAVMTWDPIELSDEENENRDELRLLFRPQFTMAEVNGEQTTQCVALLFLKSIGTATPVDPAKPPDPNVKEHNRISDFDRLAEAMLVWSIHSFLINRGVLIQSLKDVRELLISAEDLREIYRVLTQKGRGAAPFTGAEVTRFLQRYFRVAIEAQKRPEQGVKAVGSQYAKGRPTVAMFPMIPELRVEACLTVRPSQDETQEYELLHYSARFDEQTVVPLTYHDRVRQYSEKLDWEFQTDIERNADKAAADPQPEEFAQAGGRSIAECVFEDYFLLIARAVVQSSLDLMEDYAYETRDDDTAAAISSRFEISIAQIAGANSNVPSLLQPGAFLDLPGGAVYQVQPGDTLASIAAGMAPRLTPVDLLEANRLKTGIFAPNARLSLPNIGSNLGPIKVGTLLDGLQRSKRYRDVAGMTSRFLLPGSRLPRPDYLKEDPRGLWLMKGAGPEYETAPLYAMTGQQFDLPRFPRQRDPAPMLQVMGGPEPYVACSINLIPQGEGIDDIGFEMAGVALAEPNEEVSILRVELKEEDLAWIESLREQMLIPQFDPPGKIEMSHVEPRRFPLSNRMALSTPPLPFSADGVRPVQPAVPAIWTLPPAFRSALADSRATPHSFSLTLGTGNELVELRELRDYLWATALSIRIRRVPSMDGAHLSNIYEIDGMDAEAALALEQILRRAGSAPAQSFIKDVRILYRSEAPDKTPTLTSEGAGARSFILPPSATPAPPAREMHPDEDFLAMLRLLWQASSVTCGGYYLYFRGADGKSGLPSAIFSNNDAAEITVLVMFNFKTETASFVNRALVGATTGADSTIFATSKEVVTAIRIDSKTSIPDLLSKHRVSLDDLSKALGAIPLAPRVRLTYEKFFRSVDSITDWKVTLASYSTQSGDTLLNIAQRFNMSLRELLFLNANAIRFDEPEKPNDPASNLVQFSEQLFVKQPQLPPGHSGFALRRQPPVFRPNQQKRDPDPLQQLEFLFCLLGFRVAKNRSFQDSVEVITDGPDAAAQGRWRYTKVVPFFKFYDAGSIPPLDPLLPDARRNPYRGIGETMAMRLDWSDGFGNRTVSPFHSVVGVDPPNAIFPLRLGYTDELIGLERWPAVRAGYSFSKDTRELSFTADLDVSRYTPLGAGQRSAASAKKTAEADLEVFRKVFYQLTWGGTQVRLRTSLGNFADAGTIPGPTIIFLQGIIRYLTQITGRTYAFAHAVGKKGNSLEDLSHEFQILPDNFSRWVRDLLRLNPGLPDRLSEDTVVVLPNIPLPEGLTHRQGVNLSNTDVLFPLVVKFEVERAGRIDDEFLDVPSVRQVAHEIEPLLGAGVSGEQRSQAMREFATTFEEMFATIQPSGAKIVTAKLAAGLARAGDTVSDSGNRLWVVRLGWEKGFQCTVKRKQQYFFAPIPLATSFLSQQDLIVYDYTAEQPAVASASYVGIDLDEWARRFLAAVDTFLLPQHAVPARLLDRASYSTILAKKRSIAETIERTVERIAEGTEGDIKQAQELLLEKMLVRLSAAYDADTIVQIGVDVKSPYTDLSKAPRLYGQPVASPPKGIDRERLGELDFSLSTAKIPLRNGQSYLTLLFDSKTVKPEQRLKLDLTYDATAFEHELSDLRGSPGCKASSWLTFIVPAEVISANKVNLEVPIPLRACPIPPTLGTHTVAPAADLSEDGLQIEETREYSYTFDYSSAGSGHDLIHVSPRFNFKTPDQKAERSVGGVDLFQALASFERVRDRIQNDLLVGLSTYDPLTQRDETKTRNALAEFARLVEAVADAWANWHGTHRSRYEKKGEGSQAHLYVVREMENETNKGWQIIVRKCKGPADAPVPIVRIGDWEPEIETRSSSEKRIQFCKVKGDLRTLITHKDIKKEPDRVVVFEDFDVLHKQNVWAEIRTTRNEILFGDALCAEEASPRTNRNFVYRTPWVGFTDVQTPLLVYPLEVDIARLPEKTGPNGKAEKRTLEEHLARLFTRFFESVKKIPGDEKTVKRRIQLTCRYQYDLDNPSEHVDPLVITLPIVMAPPFDFTIPDGKSGTGNFIQSLSDAIENWLDDRHPSGKNGRFVFDISVYSSLGDAKLPVYRVSNLQLSLKDIKKDPVEGE